MSMSTKVSYQIMNALKRIANCKSNSIEAGFTVFELMVAIVITALVAYAAIPRFDELNASMERMNVRKNVLLDLRRAQAETVTHGCRGIFKIAANLRSYSYGCDYLAYDTANPPSADGIIFSRTLPTNFYISSDQIIIFNSKGQIVDEAAFIDSRTVTLSENTSGPTVVFATGTLLGTGLFEYN